jgi:hypothetical protein
MARTYREARMSALLHTYRIGSSTIEVWEDNVRTIFPGDLTVVAADDDMRRCVDHELAHTWIAHLFQGNYSPTLWRKARHDAAMTLPWWISDADVAHEESVVMAYTATLTGDRRPWDRYEIERGAA